MNFEDFKKFRPADGERYIIVENGEPKVVLLSFKDYRKISFRNSAQRAENQQPAKSSSEEKPDLGGWDSAGKELAENVENTENAENIEDKVLESSDFIPEAKGIVEEREKLLEGQEDSGEAPKNDLTVEDLPF